jgi:NAD-dependent protein deacetylase/lipoamidase
MASFCFNSRVIDILKQPDSKITILTGAGISAESGIPTFRGPEGYWTLGSKVYMPEELATLAMFNQHPQEVWEWYLYRLGVCLHAQPNNGHQALAEMETLLKDRFTLITQNIDNLHIRAGNSLQRTFQIHGNINFTRCSKECCTELFMLEETLKSKRENPSLSKSELDLLHCQNCNNWLRPHVLWFDEYYDEEYFRFESSLNIAANTNLLIIVGTSGATALPNHVTSLVLEKNGTIIDINPEKNTFSDMATSSPGGMFIQESASLVLPELLNCYRAG